MLTPISDEKMTSLLDGVGGETRRLEFKEGFVWVVPENKITIIQARTLKTILGINNTPQGGTLVIGVKDNGKSQHDFVGVSRAEKDSFNDTEAIARQVDSLALGAIEYEVGIGQYLGKEFIVFSISEFKDMPILCTKDLTPLGHDKPFMQKHDLYVRSSKAVPSTIKATPQELREIITMVEERDESFIRKFSKPTKAGIVLSSDARYTEMDNDL